MNIIKMNIITCHINLFYYFCDKVLEMSIIKEGVFSFFVHCLKIHDRVDSTGRVTDTGIVLFSQDSLNQEERREKRWGTVIKGHDLFLYAHFIQSPLMNKRFYTFSKKFNNQEKIFKHISPGKHFIFTFLFTISGRQ